jgi:hypothetical protein
MAGRPPSEKTFANMLRIAIKEAHETGGDKLRAVADALVNKAMTGDVPAIKEIADRLDGKVPQAVEGELKHSADDSIASLLGRIANQGVRLVPDMENDNAE